MLQPVLVDGDFENRESVKDRYGKWICKDMYVIEAGTFRQGWVTNVIDNNNGIGEIQVKVVQNGNVLLNESSSYVTDLEPSTNWRKALTEG